MNIGAQDRPKSTKVWVTFGKYHICKVAVVSDPNQTETRFYHALLDSKYKNV